MIAWRRKEEWDGGYPMLVAAGGETLVQSFLDHNSVFITVPPCPQEPSGMTNIILSGLIACGRCVDLLVPECPFVRLRTNRGKIEVRVFLACLSSWWCMARRGIPSADLVVPLS